MAVEQETCSSFGESLVEPQCWAKARSGEAPMGKVAKKAKERVT